ncbi:MAG: hypothetical protein OXU20_39510 [Myxococcales bacterium]|nr:hypothetical protein [Myxococcales bacterium]
MSWDHRSGESQAGAVCDLTPEGTFLTPFGRGADGIRDGDTVWIALEIEGQRHCLSATVRWRGFSQKHDCEGFGLQFDPETLARAQELYLKIEADGLFFVPT